MCHVRGLTLLRWMGVVAVLVPGLACHRSRPNGDNYAGVWECSSSREERFFDIKANHETFLVTDENGKTYPASIDDTGTLSISGLEDFSGPLPLPIDAESNELICSACKCNRYTKKAGSGTAEARSSMAVDKDAQRRTMDDLRKTGTAMFSWLTDQIGAGAAGQAQTDLRKYPLISRPELEKLLVPAYIAAIPEKDGWGHPYEYRVNVANTLAQQILSIRSPGRDGKYSADIYSNSEFISTNFDEDIVWVDGFFLRWPGKRTVR